MNLTIRQTMTGLISLIILVFLLVIGYTTIKIKESNSDGLYINLAGRQRMLTQKFTKEIFRDLARNETSEEGLPPNNQTVITQRLFEDTLQALRKGGTTHQDLIRKKPVEVPPHPNVDIIATLDQVDGLWEQLTDQATAIRADIDAGNPVDPARIDAVNMLSLKTLATMNQAVGQFQAWSEEKASSKYTVQVVGIFLAIVLGILAFIALHGKILKPLNDSLRLADAVADGDLSRNIDVRGEDEVALLNQALNRMSTNLSKIMSGIDQQSNQLESASSALAGVSSNMSGDVRELSSRSNSTAASSTQVTDELNNLENATRSSADSFSSIATAAEEMTATIAEIARSSEQARAGGREAADAVKGATDRVQRLNASAEEIGKVVEVITEIAGQTKLLALNANIEAVRAGDSGKGFAVVANEVKNLARQTSEATTEIKASIETMQNVTRETVDDIKMIHGVINDNRDLIDGIAAAVEEQSVTTQDIARNVASSADAVRGIQERVHNGAAGARTISKDMAEVKSAAEGVNTAAADVSTQSSNISNIVTHLREVVSRFSTT